ncbi:MAG: ExeM/NucH family extracellular endonuclease, partial [Herbiconiux sp.]|nr:ExeM/NucH family extracellular endonuclease [Herbiconiux sp.]
PGNVGGDIKLATFNVLNYFPTTGNEFVSSGLGSCTYYTDRAGAQITNNTCGTTSAPGPRGAANAANLQRQQDKIVHAINALGASIVSLEELENSIWFNKNRDFGIQTLVTALNADAGAGTWSFAASPAAADLPAKAEQDVIRSGFIYKPAQVALVGPSKVLVGSAAFGNAREPLAQGFKKVGDPDSKAFAAIVNHFKSKGSGTDDGTGQGNANPDRVNQAIALKTFASSFSTSLGGSGAVFLLGDFNAYSHEDPIQKLEENGDYVELDSTVTPGEDSYNFGGLDGSLDHVLANPAANAMVSGVDIWNINGDESVYQEYSRFNYNVTNLYNTTPFRASDHNPEIIGINTGTVTPPAAVDVQILATNDFHGRIQNDATSGSAGAAVLAGAVKQLKGANPATSFVAAGDLIGASTFESFIQ